MALLGEEGAPGQHHLQSLAFLVPGAVLLLAIVVWPTIATIRYSFYNGTATKAVGLSNYKSLFSTADTLIAFRNNVIWVLVFPFVVTVIGLVFAVLSSAYAGPRLQDCHLPADRLQRHSLVAGLHADLSAGPPRRVMNAIVQTVEDCSTRPVPTRSRRASRSRRSRRAESPPALTDT